MTRLEALRAAAKARTPGEWNAGECSVWSGEFGEVEITDIEANRIFIAICANNIDRLLAVVDAANKLIHAPTAPNVQAMYAYEDYALGKLAESLAELDKPEVE